MTFEEIAPLGFIFVVIAGIVLLWFLLRIFRKKHLWKRLFSFIGGKISAAFRQFLKKYASRNAGVYEEERESIFGSGRIAGILRRMREAMREARQFREVPWEKLDSNRDRAKYIYRHFLRNCAAAGFAFNSALTPNETSRAINDWRPQPGQEAAALTPIYNRARYGPDDTDLDDSVIKEAKEAAKELNLK